MEVLKAKKRKLLGKKVKRLRAGGGTPAVIYEKNIKSEPILLDSKEFSRIYSQARESTLVDLEVDGEPTKKVLITEVQRDPISDAIIHTNLRAVDLKEKITAEVPIELIGESPVVSTNQGILLQLIDKVEITCLPTDLPSTIRVDITGLTKVGDLLLVRDLNIDRKKIEINEDPEEPVLKIDYPEMAEEEVVVTEEEAVAGVAVAKERAAEVEEGRSEEKGESKDET